MTVKELIKELKAMPQDAKVAVVTDWETCDEFGNMPVTDVEGLSIQTYYSDQGLYVTEFKDVIFLVSE